MQLLFITSARTALALSLMLILALGATALAPAADAVNTPAFELAIGSVRDSCSGGHLGGATLTFTEEGTPEIPPGPPVRVTTDPGGQFHAKLVPGDYRVAVILEDYSQVPNTDGDQTGVFTVRTGLVSHFAFILHPPSPC